MRTQLIVSVACMHVTRVLCILSLLRCLISSFFGSLLCLLIRIMYDNQENETDQKIDPKYDFATSEKQEARAFLRERFLRVVTGVVGKQAEFNMHEKTKVSAEFRGCDTDCLEVFVRNLLTPLGKIPEAILRSSDIIYFEIEGLSLPESE